MKTISVTVTFLSIFLCQCSNEGDPVDSQVQSLNSARITRDQYRFLKEASGSDRPRDQYIRTVEEAQAFFERTGQ